MRRNLVWLLSTIGTIVLLFSYKTSTQGPDRAPTSAPEADASASAPSGGSQPSQATYTGATSVTRWGPVQVRITVTDGRITDAAAIQYPNSNSHDAQINAVAIPALNAAAIQAQSANLDSISGATVTSEGYRASLQSALDQARL